MTVVSEKPAIRDRVYFGATVQLEDENENISIYRIVGPDEHDHEENHISVDSPLARALLKRELGEEVTVNGGNYAGKSGWIVSQQPSALGYQYIVEVNGGGNSMFKHEDLTIVQAHKFVQS